MFCQIHFLTAKMLSVTRSCDDPLPTLNISLKHRWKHGCDYCWFKGDGRGHVENTVKYFTCVIKQWRPLVWLESWCSVTLSYRSRVQWSTNSMVVFWSPGAGQSLSSGAGPVSMIAGAMGSRSNRCVVTHTVILPSFILYNNLVLHPNVAMNISLYELDLVFHIVARSLSGGVGRSKGLVFWWACQGDSDSAQGYLQQLDLLNAR